MQVAKSVSIRGMTRLYPHRHRRSKPARISVRELLRYRFLQLVDLQMSQILVDLGYHMTAQLVGKGLAHLTEGCGWRYDDERFELVTVERAGELADETMHEPVFGELMPVDLFHGAPVRACIIGAA